MDMVSSTRGLVHLYGLEAALQRGVLFDILAVFVQSCGADAVQLAPGQHGLQQVSGVHAALGLAGADDVVQLVYEQDDAALGLFDLLQHGLEPLLKFAAVFCARDERAHVQGKYGLVPSAPRARRPRTMRWARPSAMAVLPTPGSPMSTGLFLVLRESMRMTLRISVSRPMTGSSLLSRARFTRSVPYFGQSVVGALRVVAR
jgi:hypothetical protein